MISHSYVTYSKEICRLFHSALGYDAEKDVDDVDPAPWTIGDRWKNGTLTSKNDRINGIYSYYPIKHGDMW